MLGLKLILVSKGAPGLNELNFFAEYNIAFKVSMG